MAQKIIKSPSSSSSKKTKLQTNYERLLQDIETRKSQLNNLQEGIRKAIPIVESELRPLIQQELEALKKRLLRLDEVATNVGVGKVNRQFFEEFMVEEIENLILKFPEPPEELKELYQKYAGQDFDIHQDDDKQMTADMIKEMFGFDVDLDELESKGTEAYFNENEEAFKNQHEANRPKTKREQARAKKQEEEQKLLEKDAKAVYMKLIKKFHPDRVQDAFQKEQYTEISTKITKAYQANDFLELLKLQIEYLDEKEADVSALADDMLKRYNKILEQQLQELEFELESTKISTMGLFEDFFDKNNKFSQIRFNKVKKDLKQHITSLEEDYLDSHKRTKGWFKEWTSAIKEIIQERAFRDVFSQMFR